MPKLTIKLGIYDPCELHAEIDGCTVFVTSGTYTYCNKTKEHFEQLWSNENA